jgi:hypothetical protein
MSIIAMDLTLILDPPGCWFLGELMTGADETVYGVFPIHVSKMMDFSNQTSNTLLTNSTLITYYRETSHGRTKLKNSYQIGKNNTSRNCMDLYPTNS